MDQTGQQQVHTAAPLPAPATILYTATGNAVQVVNVNTAYGSYQNYRTRPAKILGALQITFAIIIIICQIIISVTRAMGYEAYTGFWAPVIFIVAGAFGIQSSKSKSRCSVVTTMVMSIISAVFCSGVVSQAGLGAAWAKEDYGYYSRYEYEYEYDQAIRNLAAYSIMVIFGILEAVVAIVAAAYCCQGCCTQPNPQMIVTPAELRLSGALVSGVQYQNNPSGVYPALMGNPMAPAPYGQESTSPPEYQEKV